MNTINVPAYGAPGSLARRVQESPLIAVELIALVHMLLAPLQAAARGEDNSAEAAALAELVARAARLVEALECPSSTTLAERVATASRLLQEVLEKYDFGEVGEQFGPHTVADLLYLVADLMDPATQSPGIDVWPDWTLIHQLIDALPSRERFARYLRYAAAVEVEAPEPANRYLARMRARQLDGLLSE